GGSGVEIVQVEGTGTGVESGGGVAGDGVGTGAAGVVGSAGGGGATTGAGVASGRGAALVAAAGGAGVAGTSSRRRSFQIRSGSSNTRPSGLRAHPRLRSN